MDRVSFLHSLPYLRPLTSTAKTKTTKTTTWPPLHTSFSGRYKPGQYDSKCSSSSSSASSSARQSSAHYTTIPLFPSHGRTGDTAATKTSVDDNLAVSIEPTFQILGDDYSDLSYPAFFRARRKKRRRRQFPDGTVKNHDGKGRDQLNKNDADYGEEDDDDAALCTFDAVLVVNTGHHHNHYSNDDDDNNKETIHEDRAQSSIIVASTSPHQNTTTATTTTTTARPITSPGASSSASTSLSLSQSPKTTTTTTPTPTKTSGGNKNDNVTVAVGARIVDVVTLYFRFGNVVFDVDYSQITNVTFREGDGRRRRAATDDGTTMTTTRDDDARNEPKDREASTTTTTTSKEIPPHVTIHFDACSFRVFRRPTTAAAAPKERTVDSASSEKHSPSKSTGRFEWAFQQLTRLCHGSGDDGKIDISMLLSMVNGEEDGSIRSTNNSHGHVDTEISGGSGSSGPSSSSHDEPGQAGPPDQQPFASNVNKSSIEQQQQQQQQQQREQSSPTATTNERNNNNNDDDTSSDFQRKQQSYKRSWDAIRSIVSLATEPRRRIRRRRCHNDDDDDDDDDDIAMSHLLTMAADKLSTAYGNKRDVDEERYRCDVKLNHLRNDLEDTLMGLFPGPSKAGGRWSGGTTAGGGCGGATTTRRRRRLTSSVVSTTTTPNGISSLSSCGDDGGGDGGVVNDGNENSHGSELRKRMDELVGQCRVMMKSRHELALLPHR